MKKGYKILLTIAMCLAVILASLVQRIDRVPYQKTAHYSEWLAQQASISLDSTTGPVQVGWAKENITPTFSVPLAGHGKRWGKHFEAVHDSLYIRVVALKNPHTTVYFVSADMMIIPPNITQRLEGLLEKDGISLSDVHFGATHTHNGLGGWGEKLAGRLFAGKYDADVVEMLVSKFHLAILDATRELKPLQHICYGEYANPENISYRMPAEGGIVDDKIRSLVFIAQDSSTAEIITYAAHATSLGAKFIQLSRDYPGPLIDSLEKNDRNFALFFAGAVGSMGVPTTGSTPPENAKNVGNSLYAKHDSIALNPLHTSLLSARVAVPMPSPTLRFSKHYALRPWVFHSLFGENNAHIKITRVGNLLLLGMPGDFSGEIVEELTNYADTRGLRLAITSFNGDYIGYILPAKVYDINFHESVIMSWNGYQAGAYLTEVAKQLIDKASLQR